LTVAVHGGKPATVKLLIEAGTDSAIKDDDGNTAFDYAKEKGQKEAAPEQPSMTQL
jgi:ankyrin repeat protein